MMTYNEAFVLAAKPYIAEYPRDWDANKFIKEFKQAAKGDVALDDIDITIVDVWYDYTTSSLLSMIEDHANRIVDVYNYARTGVASGQLQNIGLKSYNMAVASATFSAPISALGTTGSVQSLMPPVPIPIEETVSTQTKIENSKPVKKIDPYARFK